MPAFDAIPAIRATQANVGNRARLLSDNGASYESAYNWPLLYLLGGSDRLLAAANRQWEAVTRQVSALKPVGQLMHEYERGYDWFHQGESNQYFYFLCLADPAHPGHRARAYRFASMYLGGDGGPANYDRHHRIIRAAHNVSRGPRWAIRDDWRHSVPRLGGRVCGGVARTGARK